MGTDDIWSEYQHIFFTFLIGNLPSIGPGFVQHAALSCHVGIILVGDLLYCKVNGHIIKKYKKCGPQEHLNQI